MRKGVFGLADAPREWYLRLSRTLAENKWIKSSLDGACWYLRDASGSLIGMLVGHVDDLLFTGNAAAFASLEAIGKELGFGSLEGGDFIWCGKRIRRAEDGCIVVSMENYHKNLRPTVVPRSRRSCMSDGVTAVELKQLRGLLGSIQWLVAQLRFDVAFELSSLQGETPTVGTLVRANKLIHDCKRSWDFELRFRNVDWSSGGLVMVSDAAPATSMRRVPPRMCL